MAVALLNPSRSASSELSESYRKRCDDEDCSAGCDARLIRRRTLNARVGAPSSTAEAFDAEDDRFQSEDSSIGVDRDAPNEGRRGAIMLVCIKSGQPMKGNEAEWSWRDDN